MRGIPLPVAFVDEICLLYSAGMTQRGISRKMGCNVSVVYRALHRAGMTDSRDDPEPAEGVETYYGDVRVKWSHDEYRRLQDVLQRRSN